LKSLPACFFIAARRERRVPKVALSWRLERRGLKAATEAGGAEMIGDDDGVTGAFGGLAMVVVVDWRSSDS